MYRTFAPPGTWLKLAVLVVTWSNMTMSSLWATADEAALLMSLMKKR
jgi:hypothetical protein